MNFPLQHSDVPDVMPLHHNMLAHEVQKLRTVIYFERALRSWHTLDFNFLGVTTLAGDKLSYINIIRSSLNMRYAIYFFSVRNPGLLNGLDYKYISCLLPIRSL